MTGRAAILLLLACSLGAGPPDRLAPFDENSLERVLAAHRGQVVLINFWATWCEPCRAEMPLLVQLEAKLRSRGFRLVTVSADEPEQDQDALEFLRKHKVPPPAYRKQATSDERFITSIDPKWSGALPALFLYGRDGQRAKTFIGETDMAALEAAIGKLL